MNMYLYYWYHQRITSRNIKIDFRGRSIFRALSSSVFLSLPPPSLSSPFPFFFLNKRRFCYRSGAGVRQRNRMSARAGCDVRAAGRPASTVNLPDWLATQTYFSLCVSFYRLPLPRPRQFVVLFCLSSYIRSFALRLARAIRYFEIRYASDRIGETRAFLK